MTQSKVQSNTYIKFTREEIKKLHFVCKSICTRPDGSFDRPTKQELLHGLIDAAYADSLGNMYEENLITDKELRDGMDELPDFLHGRILAKVNG